MKGASTLAALALLPLLLLGGGAALEREAPGDAVVVTEVPRGAGDQSLLLPGDLDRRYPPGSRLVVLADAGAEARHLSDGFVAAGGADVAADGARVAFAGRRAEDERWGIHVVAIGGGRARAIATPPRDCGWPAWLAGDRIVFSCAAGTTGSWQLWTSAPDADAARPLSFGPGAAIAPHALPDGRVLFTWIRDDARGGLYTLNPDGSLLDGFAGLHDAGAEWAPRATAAGEVLYVARDASGSHLERLDLGRPDATRRRIDAAVAGAPVQVASVAPLAREQALLAVRDDAGRWSIARLAGDALVTLHDDPARDPIEVATRPLAPPRGRPSSLTAGTSTGRLLGYDADRSDHRHGPAAGAPRATALRIEAVPATAAAAALAMVAEDGSFYLELPGDTAFRLTTVDGDGEAIASCAPIWVRSGEVRGCFGCHEGHEAAPHNRFPAAIAGAADVVALATEVPR